MQLLEYASSEAMGSKANGTSLSMVKPTLWRSCLVRLPISMDPAIFEVTFKSRASNGSERKRNCPLHKSRVHQLRGVLLWGGFRVSVIGRMQRQSHHLELSLGRLAPYNGHCSHVHNLLSSLLFNKLNVPM